MFFVFKRVFLFVTILMLLLNGIEYIKSNVTIPTNAPSQKYIIVIDAGHGGKDKGTTGVNTKIDESDLNLIYANTLSEYFKNAGFRVVLTREDKNSLSDSGLGFHKKKDMNKRKEIIKNSGANLMISLHMNEYLGDRGQSGAQVFYELGNETSKLFSEYLQEELNKLNKKNRINIGGDYFIVKENTMPSVIVECGFLSNPEEEKLLQTKEHREKVCYAIFVGVMKYLSSNKI